MLLFKKKILNYQITFDGNSVHVNVNNINNYTDYDLINLWIHYFSKLAFNCSYSNYLFIAITSSLSGISSKQFDTANDLDSLLASGNTNYSYEELNSYYLFTGTLLKKNAIYSINTKFPYEIKEPCLIKSLYALF